MPKTKTLIQKRDWSQYTDVNLKLNMSNRLNVSNVLWNNLNVFNHWNALENVIIKAIDDEAPLKMLKLT